MSTSFYARPVIPILIAFLAGIFFGDLISGFGAVAIGISVLGLVITVVRLNQARAVVVSPLVLFSALGYLAIQPWASPDFPSNHVVHQADNRKVIIDGVIIGSPLRRPNGQRIEIDASRLKSLDGVINIKGKVLVTIGRGEMSQLARGDIIRIRGRLKRVVGFHNPGGFDYERYMAYQKIWCRMWVAPNRVEVLSRISHPSLTHRIDAFRQRLANRIDDSVTGDSRSILKALVIGDRWGISPSLRRDFNRTGTGHLLAISGLHIGIVATVAFFVFRWLLGHSRMLLRRAWIIRVAALLTFIPVICYGVMAGMSPSTQRAVMMVAVFLLAYLTGKLQDTLNTLAVAAWIILAIDPPSLFSISFQLSFAAVAFIVFGFSQPWPKRNTLPGPHIGIINRVVTMVGVTILAIMGTLPLVMDRFNEVSLIGVGTNLLAIPLVGFIAVPLGLMGMFIFPVSSFLSTIFFQGAGWVIDAFLTGISFLSGIDSISLKTFSPSLIEKVIYYLFCVSIILLAPVLVAYLKGQSITTMAKVTRLKQYGAILLIAVAAGMLDGAYWGYQRYWRDDLRVTVIDVGSGSAVLVSFPRGPVMLIDGGGFSDNKTFDVGEKVVAPLLWRRKIMTVDTIVLSHPNADHLNGLIYIAKHFNVKHAWTNGQSVDTEGYRLFQEVIKQKNISVSSLDRLGKTITINSATIDILHPVEPKGAPLRQGTHLETNNQSLVVKLTFGDISFLLPGDIEKEGEAAVVKNRGHDLNSTVLLAPHHGSRSSSSSLFLDAVSPETVVISSAVSGRYKFPHPEILQRYEKRGYSIFNTAHSGAIDAFTNGRTITIEPSI